MEIKTDFLIIGGSLAGSSLAYFLSKNNIDCLIVESKKVIGKPVQCAEFVPIQLYHKFPEFFDNAVSQKINNMITYTPWTKNSVNSEGFILNREVFDKNVYELAIKKGSNSILGAIFIGLEDKNTALIKTRSNDLIKVKFEFLVGADGPKSKVSEITSQKNEFLATSIQGKFKLKERLEDILIFFKSYIKGGYGWIFPKKDFANVGLGYDIRFNLNLNEVFNTFIEDLKNEGFIEGDPISKTGGFIPIGPLKKVYKENILLVGDAGGFCHPITGGGIAPAIMSSYILSKALKNNDITEFEEESEDTFGIINNRAFEKRQKYLQRWDNLKEIIPKTWISFEEYYKN